MTDQRPFTHAAWTQYLSEHQLMASYCPDSDTIYLPPRAICPKTHSTNMEWRELSGKGNIAAFTSIFVGPSAMVAAGYDRTNPYVSGIVELDEGVKISAYLLGVDAKNPDSIQIGTPVTVDFIEQGEGEKKQTLLAFRV